MDMSEKLMKNFNEQINKELYSDYLYLSMASYLESKGLMGMASWMKKQSKEENEHAMKLYTFVNDRNGRVVFDSIDKPPYEWDNVKHVFEDSLKHEQLVTKSIHDLYEQALEEKDHPAASFLKWFIDEQVEEESTVREILDKLSLIDESKNGLLMLDNELARR